MRTLTHDTHAREFPTGAHSAVIVDARAASPTRSRVASGLSFAIISSVAFGMSGSLARMLLESGWSAGAAVTVRVSIAAVVLLIPAWRALDRRWSLLRANLVTICVYGAVAVAACQLAYFNAIRHLPIGVALLIEYTAPIAVVGWLWLRHGQRPSAMTALGGIVAIAGLALVLDVFNAGSMSVVGVLWALGAMVGAAVYFIINADDESGLPPMVLAAGGLAVGSLSLIAAALIGVLDFQASTADVSFPDFTVPFWVPLLFLGTITAALAYVTGIEAGRRLGSRVASFVALSEVVAALVFAWLLLGELPVAIQLVGGLLILAGVVIVKLGENATQQLHGDEAGSSGANARLAA